MQARNGVIFEVLAAVEYFQPTEGVIIEQVKQAQQTEDGVYAAELQANLLKLGYQARHRTK